MSAAQTLPFSRVSALQAVRAKLSGPRLVRAITIYGVLIVIAVLLLRSAWVAEDSYIANRVVENVLHGYGPVWNVDDRVQVYTDPLFLALCCIGAWVSGNLFLTIIFLSFALSMLAVWLILREAPEMPALIAGLALIFSKGFQDFSISGLENPMTHFLIALFLIAHFKRKGVFTTSFIAALAVTNREDTALFFLPALLIQYWRSNPVSRSFWIRLIAGWSPFLAWSAFSLVYYGFIFPNTAYAKLNTGIAHSALIVQGYHYFQNAATFDTASLVAIALGIATALIARQRALAIGIVLNLLYVLSVGGDFMASRFFTPAVFFSAGVLAQYWRPRKLVSWAALALITLVGMSVPFPTVKSATQDFGIVMTWPEVVKELGKHYGIADERRVYFPHSSLLNYHHNPVWPDAGWAFYAWAYQHNPKSPRVTVMGNIGYYGYFIGPRFHVIDPYGLADALTARLPIHAWWRIGHFNRDLPPGYKETIETGRNVIVDPNIHQFYDHLKPIVSGPLFTRHRFREILAMNLGKYNHLLPKPANPPPIWP